MWSVTDSEEEMKVNLVGFWRAWITFMIFIKIATWNVAASITPKLYVYVINQNYMYIHVHTCFPLNALTVDINSYIGENLDP